MLSVDQCYDVTSVWFVLTLSNSLLSENVELLQKPSVWVLSGYDIASSPPPCRTIGAVTQPGRSSALSCSTDGPCSSSVLQSRETQTWPWPVIQPARGLPLQLNMMYSHPLPSQMWPQLQPLGVGDPSCSPLHIFGVGLRSGNPTKRLGRITARDNETPEPSVGVGERRHGNSVSGNPLGWGNASTAAVLQSDCAVWWSTSSSQNRDSHCCYETVWTETEEQQCSEVFIFMSQWHYSQKINKFIENWKILIILTKKNYC